MAQIIDIKYQEKAMSQPLNKRFLDVTGAYIQSGFRIQKGTTDFTLSFMRGGYTSNIAVSPSGARVEETTDLIDRVSVNPNLSAGGATRVDSVYMVYQYGTKDAVADYVVIEGSNVPPPNPNNKTHLLLGHVYVQPNNLPIRTADVISSPYGFSKLEVAGKSFFHGPAEFDKDVIFKGRVEFPGGIGPGIDASSSFVEQLPMPITATEGQTDFVLPSSYTMGTQTLFVYVNGDLIPPSEWSEVNNTTFRFYAPLTAGAKVWAFWYRGLNLYKPGSHDHDDLYYRKYEVAQRAVRYATDFFAGNNGRKVDHYLGNKNYVVVSVIPVEKTNAVGDISVEKRDNEIIIYNSGTYRGMFDLTYIVKAPYEGNLENIQYVDFMIESTDYNNIAGVYTVVNHKRKNGSMHMKTSLLAINSSNRYTRLQQDIYNTTGTKVIETKMWALVWDEVGNVKQKTRIS